MPDGTRQSVALTAVADDAAIPGGVDRLFELLGDPLAGLSPGAEVLIKPNLFQTTPGFHVSPALLAAIARLVAEHGARPVIGERTAAIYEILRDHEAAKYARVVSFDDLPLRITGIAGATSLRVPIAVPELILDCDYFIGVPQLRTHASVVYSNAMKNLVGLLPGYTTRIVHMAGVDESTVDLNLMRPQDLVVCDGTTVIEGNYPMDGQARHVGFLAAGRNAVAVDVAVGTLAGFDPESVAYLRDAHQRGMGPLALEDIDLLGTPLADLAFDMVKAPVTIVAPREGIHIHAEHACPACSRFVAGAMQALAGELRDWDGEMTVISGPQVEMPPLRGVVVLVGNCLYESRELGIFIEGCPPRAIQLAAFRYAMGKPVGAHERTQFRVPPSLVGRPG
jgi:uncharacterized protein (DUF362 family)